MAKAVKPLLIIECGVAQTRAALIKDDRVTRFWFGPARGDEQNDQTPRRGRRFTGRVRSINTSLNAAFVDIGDGLDAFLPLNKKPEAALSDGALISVSVKSPPRQGKGAVLKFLSVIEDAEETPAKKTPGRAPPFTDAAVEAVNAIGGPATKILIDSGKAYAVLVTADLETGITGADIHYTKEAVALFDVHDASDALAGAFEQSVPLNGGGRLVIDEAQALTAIDVDSGALGASSPARLREKIATAAADEALRQIGLRNIGGHVVIDFPSIGAKAARTRFRAHLTKVLARLDGAGGASFSQTGLFSFTAPHGAQSLMERFTEEAPADPVPGRCFTLDWQAKSALREAEHRLRAGPQVKLRLGVGAALYAYLNDSKIWIERLKEIYGPRIDLTADEKLEARAYDLSE